MRIPLLLLFIVFSSLCKGQSLITIQSGPLHVMNCPDACTTLHANFPKPLRTNTYNISNTSFAPIGVQGTPITLADDKFSNAIPLGFEFCFFENVYNQVYVSDNGVLTFNSAYAGGNCNNNTQQTLPYFNSTFPDNAIFFLFMDINPSLGGSIRYSTVGTAPYRKFVLDFQNVRLFGNTCSPATNSFQVVLCETTHIIDIFITNKVNCDANPANYANYATVGIQNPAATLVYTAPGKHASTFTATSEGIRIAPAGPIDYAMYWKDAGGNVIAANIDSVQFCPGTFPYQYVTAELTINCPLSNHKDSVTLFKPLPVFNTIQLIHPLCMNDQNGSILVGATVNAPPAQYALNNGPFGPSNVFTNLGGGFYTVKVKDANGCEKDTVVELIPQVQLQLVVDSLVNPDCPDTIGMVIVHITGGTAPYNISWSNGDVGFICDSIGPGVVIATVSDANGCLQYFPVAISYDSLPEVSAVYTNPVCGDTSGSITITITLGTPPYSVLWNTGDTTLSLTNLDDGIYNVSITDSNGCHTGLGLVLSDTLTTMTQKSQSPTTCGLNNGSAGILAFNGLPPYTYYWSPGGMTTASVSGLSPGVYTCLTADANNCTKLDTVSINPSLATSNQYTKANANCDTSNGFIYLNNVINATGSYTILWSTGQTGNAISGLPAGTYWVETSDALGCVKRDTIYLLNDGKPQLQILSYVPPLCFGDTGSAVLGGMFGTPPYKYSLDGITFSSNAQLNGILAGIYTIYITDANSCINSTVVTFTQPPLLDITSVSDTVICFNDHTATLTFSGSGGVGPYVYSFNNGIYQPDTAYYNNTQGAYPVIIKDAHNCTRLIYITVPGPEEALDVSFVKKDVYCFENNTGSFTATIHGGWTPYTYTWDPAATGLSFTGLGETQMEITVTDAMGCSIAREVEIENLKCCKMVVPNAFTPNGDGLNDAICPLPISEVSAIKFSIYDRWGHMVYHTKTLHDRWDGRDHEIPCNMGVYFYYLEYDCPREGHTFIEKGDITLIR